MKTITEKMLENHFACAEQVQLFARVFPHGAPCTMAGMAKARKAGLNVSWAVCLLSPEARAEHNKVCTAAWAGYSKACSAAWAEFDKVCTAALLAALKKS